MSLYKIRRLDRNNGNMPRGKIIKADSVDVNGSKVVFYNRVGFRGRRKSLVAAFSTYDSVEKTSEEDEFIDGV